MRENVIIRGDSALLTSKFEFYHYEIFQESSRHVNRWSKIRDDLDDFKQTNDIANCVYHMRKGY